MEGEGDQEIFKKEKVRAIQLDKRTVLEGKWLRRCDVDFKNERGDILNNWEMVERVRTNPNEVCNSVDILPIVKYSNGKRKLLMIANYRPPVNGYTIEFPAGMLEGSDLIENARRELKEETGFTAYELKELDFSPVLYCDPWKSNETTKYIIAYIDGDKECNKNPHQDLENEENIDVFQIDIDSNMHQNLQKIVLQNNYFVAEKVYAILIGLQLLTLSI